MAKLPFQLGAQGVGEWVTLTLTQRGGVFLSRSRLGIQILFPPRPFFSLLVVVASTCPRWYTESSRYTTREKEKGRIIEG